MCFFRALGLLPHTKNAPTTKAQHTLGKELQMYVFVSVQREEVSIQLSRKAQSWAPLVRVTVTHHTVQHLTVVRVRQLLRKAQSWAPLVRVTVTHHTVPHLTVVESETLSPSLTCLSRSTSAVSRRVHPPLPATIRWRSTPEIACSSSVVLLSSAQ